jgi:hypothetical protein
MSSRPNGELSAKQEAELRRYKAVVEQIARQQCAQQNWLRGMDGDVSNFTLTQLQKAMKQTEILNIEAFVTTVVKNRINDLGRRHKVEEGRMYFQDFERSARGGDELIQNNRGMRGLTLDIIEQEDRRVLSLKASAAVAIMPDEKDRDLLKHRFYGFDVSITELAATYGKTPNSMANYLQKILGGNGDLGAIEPVYQVVERLQLRTASAFVKILQEYDDRDQLTDPIGGAISHLEFAGTYSEAHRQLAVLGVARLRWLGRREIDNRGLTNKLLKRLVKAACFYVHEPEDARHDRLDANGLRDDVNVLEVVSEVVREFQTK